MRNAHRTWIVSKSCYCCFISLKFLVFSIFILFSYFFYIFLFFHEWNKWSKRWEKLNARREKKKKFIKLFKTVWKTYWIEWYAAKICRWTKTKQKKCTSRRNTKKRRDLCMQYVMYFLFVFMLIEVTLV